MKSELKTGVSLFVASCLTYFSVWQVVLNRWIMLGLGGLFSLKNVNEVSLSEPYS